MAASSVFQFYRSLIGHSVTCWLVALALTVHKQILNMVNMQWQCVTFVYHTQIMCKVSCCVSDQYDYLLWFHVS
jgi:hypothetical protein